MRNPTLPWIYYVRFRLCIYRYTCIYIYLLIYTYTYTCFCKYIKFMNLGNLKLMNMLLSYLIKCSWAHPKHPSPPWSIKGDFCPIRPKICLWNLLKSAIFYGAGIIFCNTSMFLVLVFFSPKTSSNSNNSYPQIPCQGASCATDCQSGWGALGSSACVNDWQLTQQAMKKGKGGGDCKWLGWEWGNVKGLMG